MAEMKRLRLNSQLEKWAGELQTDSWTHLADMSVLKSGHQIHV